MIIYLDHIFHLIHEDLCSGIVKCCKLVNGLFLHTYCILLQVSATILKKLINRSFFHKWYVAYKLTNCFSCSSDTFEYICFNCRSTKLFKIQ